MYSFFPLSPKLGKTPNFLNLHVCQNILEHHYWCTTYKLQTHSQNTNITYLIFALESYHIIKYTFDFTKMIKTAFWISTVCVLSSFARPQIQQQQQNIQPENELPEIQKKDIQISKFHVNTSIQMRYGIQYTYIIVKLVMDFLTHGYKIISEFIVVFCELTRYILLEILKI